MIFVGSKIKVIDNSGARFVKCIKIYGKLALSKGVTGDIILVSVRNINPRKKIKKGEIYKGILVRTCVALYRYGGISMRFTHNGVVLFNKRDGLLGTRILEPVAFELRNLNQFKIVSLAPALI